MDQTRNVLVGGRAPVPAGGSPVGATLPARLRLYDKVAAMREVAGTVAQNVALATAQLVGYTAPPRPARETSGVLHVEHMLYDIEELLAELLDMSTHLRAEVERQG